MTIPAANLTAGDNRLELTYELHFDKDERRCDEDEWDQAWGVIHDITTVETKFSDVTPELFLTSFPVPFDTGTLVVLPSDGRGTTRGGFKLFNELGRSIENRVRAFEVTTADQVTEDVLRRQSAILLGRPTENQWVAARCALPREV